MARRLWSAPTSRCWWPTPRGRLVARRDHRGYAEQSGRSVIIVMNKWDLALEAAKEKAGAQKKPGGKAGASPSKLVSDYEPMVRRD